MFRLKIIFHKCEVFCMGSAQEKSQELEQILTCKSGDLPLEYLGMLFDEKIIKYSGSNPTIEK